jgi:hypothetical protein
MNEMASALSQMGLSSFGPLVDAEAPDKSCRIATNAAISRMCPIRDAADYWNPGNALEMSDTVLGGPAPGRDSTLSLPLGKPLLLGCKRDRMAAPLATEPLAGYWDK